MRSVMSAAAVLMFIVGPALADDQRGSGKKSDPSEKVTRTSHVEKAKIVNVDPKKGTITLQIKGKDGKALTQTFKLTEDIEYADSTGRVALIDLFRSGDEVLVVEEKGHLRQMTQMPKKKGTGSDTTPNQSGRVRKSG